MTSVPPPQDDRPIARSHRRDAHVRSVSRTTRVIAALAVLGTGIFGGLAAANTNSSSASTSGTTATPASSGSASSTQASRTSSGLASAAVAPSATTQAPVASSGGS